MIVVATHDRLDFLAMMVRRLCSIDLNGHDVLFVDTNSQDAEYRNVCNLIAPWFLHYHPNFKFVRKEYTCWDTGAYVHAYRNYKAEKYIFLQDSLYIRNPNFIVEMDKMLDEHDVVPIFNITYEYDRSFGEEYKEEQRRLCEEGIEVTSLPEYGIFGPIFGARKSALDKIPNEWFREPKTKAQGCAMERRWALMFHLTGATQKTLVHVAPERWYDFWDGKHDDFKQQIEKIWVHRP